jgi:hypothetical protein
MMKCTLMTLDSTPDQMGYYFWIASTEVELDACVDEVELYVCVAVTPIGHVTPVPPCPQ